MGVKLGVKLGVNMEVNRKSNWTIRLFTTLLQNVLPSLTQTGHLGLKSPKD